MRNHESDSGMRELATTNAERVLGVLRELSPASKVELLGLIHASDDERVFDTKAISAQDSDAKDWYVQRKAEKQAMWDRYIATEKEKSDKNGAIYTRSLDLLMNNPFAVEEFGEQAGSFRSMWRGQPCDIRLIAGEDETRGKFLNIEIPIAPEPFDPETEGIETRIVRFNQDESSLVRTGYLLVINETTSPRSEIDVREIIDRQDFVEKGYNSFVALRAQANKNTTSLPEDLQTSLRCDALPRNIGASDYRSKFVTERLDEIFGVPNDIKLDEALALVRDAVPVERQI